MSTVRQPRERRGKPSHREDLRGDLLAAACAVLAREGHEGISIRRLAEDVGVSSAAPYHHFPDRRSLLLAVALEGYGAMFNAAQEAIGQVADPRARLTQIFRAFITFAVTNPNMFTLMYESELVRPALAPEIEKAQDSGFQRLQTEVCAVIPDLSEREQSIRLTTMWSAIFGFALQSNRAMIRTPGHEPAPTELADEVVNLAIRLLDL
jgi:AcrR family transcriptional regulator